MLNYNQLHCAKIFFNHLETGVTIFFQATGNFLSVYSSRSLPQQFYGWLAYQANSKNKPETLY